MIKQTVTIKQTRVVMDIYNRVTIKPFRSWSDKAMNVRSFANETARRIRSIEQITSVYLITHVEADEYGYQFYGYYEPGSEPVLFEYFGALTDHYLANTNIQMRASE